MYQGRHRIDPVVLMMVSNPRVSGWEEEEGESGEPGCTSKREANSRDDLKIQEINSDPIIQRFCLKYPATYSRFRRVVQVGQVAVWIIHFL